MRPDSRVHRVYATFDSLEEFSSQANQAVADLRRYLDDQNKSTTATLPRTPVPSTAEIDPIPKPPSFYAEPSYIGSHKFVGRQAQLKLLNDWAQAADPNPVLLFDAIGGSGKSMLTWEWTTKYSNRVRERYGRAASGTPFMSVVRSWPTFVNTPSRMSLESAWTNSKI